jgi:hypothetical protein
MQVSVLTGKKADMFVIWLNKIKDLLPVSMKIGEALEIFERKYWEGQVNPDHDTVGDAGTSCDCEVAESAPDSKKLFLQEQ